MAKLKIQNIGPIKEGLIEFKGVTVFIGSQGAGKSTIAKIYSTLSWIEKALVRGDFKPSHLKQYNRFKKHFEYQNIKDYFNENSELIYKGDAYEISYKNSKVEVKEIIKIEKYFFPKIMYVPAERSFITTVDRPDLIKRLPMPLYTFLTEYDNARQSIAEIVKLPIGNVTYEYRKQNKKSFLIGNGYKVDLLQASSGFQSFVPLFLVTRYLSGSINKEKDLSHSDASVDEGKKLRQEIDKIFGSSKLSEEIKVALLEKLSDRKRYSRLINIVEEPEQNLYPSSQKHILWELLRYKNKAPQNNLIITTHSPYIINYLTLAIKAYVVRLKAKKNINIINKIEDILPIDSIISADTVNIYEISTNGTISKLDNYNGLPSDENYLNNFLAESNELFVKLLEIEDLCQ